jgi:hypothetical protein
MTRVIFAGPSLHGYRDLIPVGIEVRAPAGRGDILVALRQGARRIGLIDGYFGDRPSVWHKEILLALSEGAAVLGAASMGALRAAECSAYGMIGSGEVFSDYLDGRRTADADVAVLHGPEEVGFVPLTVALVDAEDAIWWMEARRRLSRGEAELVRIAARDLNFRDRTWTAIRVAAGLPRSLDDIVKGSLDEMGPLMKTRDALDLVAGIAADSVEVSHFAVPRTGYLRDLEADIRRLQAKARGVTRA